MEAAMPPAWANMLYHMYSYIEEFGCGRQHDSGSVLELAARCV